MAKVINILIITLFGFILQPLNGQSEAIDQLMITVEKHFDKGDYQNALSVLDQAIEVNGEPNAKIILWQAKTYVALGQKEKVDKLLITFYNYPASDSQKLEMDKLMKEMLSAEQDDIEENPDDYAEFPGGRKAYVKFLKRNLKHPDKAKQQEIFGNVKSSFIVDEKGRISDINIIESPHPILSAEAIRFIKLFPTYKPAIKDGKPVKSKIIMGFSFRQGS